MTSVAAAGGGVASAATEEFYNCQVLACPEWSDHADMLNDTRYDYYTMYGDALRKSTTKKLLD